jgi:hypothetical protein
MWVIGPWLLIRSGRDAPRPIATSPDVAKAGLQNLVEIGDAIFDERVEAPETAGSAYSAATPQA